MTIINDDKPGEIGFDKPGYEVRESDGEITLLQPAPRPRAAVSIAWVVVALQNCPMILSQRGRYRVYLSYGPSERKRTMQLVTKQERNMP